MTMFARLLGSAAAPAVAQTPPASTPAGAPAADTGAAPSIDEAKIESALQAARGEGVTAGATAERERTSAVLNSDAGKANPSMAAWMLNAAPSADSASIIAQLAAAPAAAPAASTAAPAAPAPAAPAPAAPLTQPLAETPKVDLAGGAGNDGGSGGITKADTQKMVDESIANLGNRMNGTGATFRGAAN